MMDEKLLDELLPLPTQDDLKNKIVDELEEEGFKITNFNTGGVFYTLMMIFIKIRIELIKLLRVVVSNMFVSTAEGVWLDLKAADYSKRKKPATKTKGYVTLSRSSSGMSLTIPKGYVFKTEKDVNGNEYRYSSVESVVVKDSDLEVKVLVEAEKEGASYNLPPGQISKMMIHVESFESVTNKVGWIVSEGSDTESSESLRDRTKRSWAELSTYPIKDKYRNVCEAVSGVLFATVDDQHPRGQGTIDIILTSTAGAASQSLIDAVVVEVDKMKGPYDNVLVKSAVVVSQDVAVTLTISNLADDTGLVDRAKTLINEFFRIDKNRNLNEFYKANLIFALKKEIEILKNIKISTPVDDVVLSNDKVIVLGNVTVNVEKV